MVNVAVRRGTVLKQKVFVVHNYTMGGLDRAYQQLSCYPSPKERGKKYYKKIFLPDGPSSLNSNTLNQKCGEEQTPHSFQLYLMKEIKLKHHTSPTPASRSGRPSFSEPPNPPDRQAFSFICPETEELCDKSLPSIQPKRDCHEKNFVTKAAVLMCHCHCFLFIFF